MSHDLITTTYARPIIEAVAMSSSNNAKDTLPETEYGFNSGSSEYFIRTVLLIFAKLTCPIVQPPNLRSEISS